MEQKEQKELYGTKRTKRTLWNKKNFMEQKELLRNDEAIVIKPPGIGGAVVILLTCRHQSMTHLSYEATRLIVKYRNETQSNF